MKRSSNIWLPYSNTTVYSPFHGFIWDQHIDQLPVGLLVQLVEHCNGIAEVMGSNPVQAWIFFRPSFQYYLSSVHYCEDRFHSQLCVLSAIQAKVFFQFKHSLMIIVRPSESCTLRWDSMKTSHITEEYWTVLIIAQRGQTCKVGIIVFLPVFTRHSAESVAFFFLELKSGLKIEKWVTGDIICN